LTGLTAGLVVTGLGHRLILIGCEDVRTTLREARHAGRGVDKGLLSLVLLGGAAQVVTVTDTLSIRALSSTSQVGVYRAASQVPTQLAGLLYRGFDTLLSRLAGADETSAASLIRRPAVVLACVNGAVLGLLISFREPVMTLMLGESSGQADRVVALFAVVWLLNGAVHPAALLLIAQRRQGSLLRLIGAEYAANLVLTIALVPSLGATGSAVATLVTLGASNLVFLPRILRRELPSLPVRRHLLVECLLPALAVTSLAVGVGWITQQ
jgi:O-antigen/teichoic acid export membrane protein